MKQRFAIAVALASLTACGEAPTEPMPDAGLAPRFSATTDAFTTVGAATYTVPAGVTSIKVVAVGGGGGGTLYAAVSGGTAGRIGGNGARVSATLSVTPGQVLDLYVGAGTAGSNWSVNGGGSTTIFSGGVPLMIAGGGGGAGQFGAGGSAGGPDGVGYNGENGRDPRNGRNGIGGVGGAGGIGGAGGTGTVTPHGTAGGNGNGGVGGYAGGNTPIIDGGGGHGGWYGGGGGGGYGGGGGGGALSGGAGGGSFGPAGTTYAIGGNGGQIGLPGGNGSIEITYEAKPVATSADQCKNGGWQFVTDDLGNSFNNQGDCVSFVATKGKNKGAG